MLSNQWQLGSHALHPASLQQCLWENHKPKSLVICRHSEICTAVLRKVVQLQAEGAWQQPLQLDPQHPTAEQLGIYHSHPTWMVERWLQQFGFQETIELLQSNNRCVDCAQTIAAIRKAAIKQPFFLALAP